jgi:DNA-binding beta-propeller fold protein YncE
MSLQSKRWIAATVSICVSLLLTAGVHAGDGTGELVYTASNTIDVVDVEQGTVLKEIPLQRFVTDMVFTSSGDRAYVAVSDGVTIIDTREHKVVGHLDGPPAKTLELSPDNTILYILEHLMVKQEDGTTKGGDYEVNAIDIATGRSLHKFVLGEKYYDIFLTADGASLFTLKFQSNKVEVIDTRTWQRSRTITVDTDELLWKSAGSREKGELYIPQYGTKGHLWILKTDTGEVRKVELNEQLPLRGITYASRTGRLYLLTLGSLLAVNTDDGKIVKKVNLDVPYQGISCSKDGKHLFLSNPVYHSGGSLTVMDGESLETVKVIDTPTISPISVAALP